MCCCMQLPDEAMCCVFVGLKYVCIVVGSGMR